MSTPLTFFVARVTKLGELTTERLQLLLASSLRLPQAKFVYSIVDTEEGKTSGSDDEVPYFYGRMVKFAPDGEVTVVNTELGTSEKKPEPNLELSASRFVFLPSLMLLAYENVWHHFEYKQFPKF